MLIAKTDGGTLLSLIDNYAKETLLELRERQGFYCPACLGKVILKLGEQKIFHFAHERSPCHAESEAETPYHLQGKKQLFYWLQSQVDSQLEHYISSINQRPDIFVTHNNQTYAIEYQCSTISREIFQKRTREYEKIGITPIWILGAHKLKRLSTYRLKLTSFQWQFAHQQLPQIFYYCPETNYFIRLTNIVPFSTSIVFSIPHVVSLAHLSFQQLIDKTLTTTRIVYSEWLKQKKKWRITLGSFPSDEVKCFVDFMHEKGLYPTFFPAEVGIPSAYGETIATPAYIWQMYVLVGIVEYARHSSFTDVAVIQFFDSLLYKKRVVLRPLSLSQHTYDDAVCAYVKQLVQLNILTTDGEVYWINRMPKTPTSTEQALKEDEIVMVILQKKEGKQEIVENTNKVITK